MYKLFKDVIEAQNFKLDDMQAKIKKSYIVGDITEEEQKMLLSLAAENVNHEAERPGVIELLQGIVATIKTLEKRVAALENGESTSPEEPDTTEYEEWAPWDGISDKYQYGAIVRHKGALYQSTLNGQNVWEPGTVSFWVLYTEE